MLTSEGQNHTLKLWLSDSMPKYLMLINEPKNIDKEVTLKTVKESFEKSYKRQKLESNEWSLPSESYGDAEIVSAEKAFGPFTGNIDVTHVGLCSSEAGNDGILYLVSPIQHFIDTKTAQTFGPGEVFSVSLAHKNI